MTIPSFEVGGAISKATLGSANLKQTIFNVPLSCESCIKDVSQSLYSLPGISNVSADLKSQLVTVEGSIAPSAIVKAIQDTGRDAILRGSGKADSPSPTLLIASAGH